MLTLLTQSSLQASHFATWGARAQLHILSPNHCVAASQLLSLATVFLMAITYGGWKSLLRGNWTALWLHCSCFFCSCLYWGFIWALIFSDHSSPAWLRVLQGKHRCTRKCSDNSEDDNFLPGVDSKPGYFLPMNLNKDWIRDNVIFSLYFKAGVQKALHLLEHHLFLFDEVLPSFSPLILSPCDIYSEDPVQIPIYLIILCLPILIVPIY